MVNIAEGHTRRSDTKVMQYLFMAMSSTTEVQNHLLVAKDLGCIDKKQCDKIYRQTPEDGSDDLVAI
jgi:four helix bundle protein